MQPDATGPKVLVIDDSPSEQGLLGFALHGRNFRHLMAKSLEEAGGKLALAPDVVVLDVLLPDSMGIEDAIRFAKGPAAAFPLIVHTSFWLEAIDKAAAAAGLVLIRKNADFGPLLDLIQQVYDNSRPDPVA